MSTSHPLVLASLLAFALHLPLPAAAPPGVLNHQGRIAANGENFGSPAPATGHFKFALVDAGGARTFWTNDNTNTGTPGDEPDTAVPVTVTNGFYSVGLGDTTLPNMTTAIAAGVFTANAEVFLRIWFSADNITFELLSPDHRIFSNAYALSARSLSLPTGATAGHVLTSDPDGKGSWAPPVPGPQGPPGADGALAGLACGIGQVAVFNGAEWVCQDFPGFEWTPAPQTIDPFRVEISPGPPAQLQEWNKFLEGGLLLNYPDKSCWQDLTLSGPVVASDPTRPPRNPLTTRDFDVTELYGPDTVRVQGISARFPKVPSTDGRFLPYKTFQPGQPVYGNVTIIGRTGTNSTNVKQWVKDTYDGKDIRKDITINLRTSPVETAELEINLVNCLPVSWRPLHRNINPDPRNPSAGLEALEIKVDRIEITSHPTKPSLAQWYSDMLNPGGGADVFKDVSITTLNRDGSDQTTINYLECFLTSYSLSPLNSEAENVECRETIEIAVGYSDNFLN